MHFLYSTYWEETPAAVAAANGHTVARSRNNCQFTCTKEVKLSEHIALNDK
jgi:hypothetical protein